MWEYIQNYREFFIVGGALLGALGFAEFGRRLI